MMAKYRDFSNWVNKNITPEKIKQFFFTNLRIKKAVKFYQGIIFYNNEITS